MSEHYLIALLIGIVGSIVVHLSQGLMRLAILRRQSGDTTHLQRKMYIAGMLMNFSAPFWVIFANRFAPTVVYTSVYSIGLLALLWFSCTKLNLTLRKRDIAGAVMLTLGAILLATGSISASTPPMHQLSTVPMWWFVLLLCLIVLPVAIACKQFSWLPQGLMFGAIGGAFLAIDSLFKGIAQSDSGAAAFLPSTTMGIVLFAASFIGAGMAFAMTQWAHVRGAPPSATIAGYDAAYMVVPVIMVSLAMEQGNIINLYCLLGLACILPALGLLHRR